MTNVISTVQTLRRNFPAYGQSQFLQQGEPWQ